MYRITETYKDDKTIVLKLDGRLVNTEEADFEKLCIHHVDEKNKTVVLDFSGLEFIDDESTRILIEKMEKQKIILIYCSPFIRSLLTNYTPGTMKK